jgi:hypothetical protein
LLKIVAADKEVAYDIPPHGKDAVSQPTRRSRLQRRACEMVGALLTSAFILWVGGLVTNLDSSAFFLLLGLALIFVILVVGALFASNYFSVPLSIFALLLIVWTFFVPVSIPTPPFRSALVSALESSNAKLRAIQRDNITADAEALARFLPNGLTIKEAEVVLHKEWFYCGPFQDAGTSEAARWGEKYRHYMICKRYTYYHPFGMYGWSEPG